MWEDSSLAFSSARFFSSNGAIRDAVAPRLHWHGKIHAPRYDGKKRY
jgi:hypothetical protein